MREAKDALCIGKTEITTGRAGAAQPLLELAWTGILASSDGDAPLKLPVDPAAASRGLAHHPKTGPAFSHALEFWVGYDDKSCRANFGHPASAYPLKLTPYGRLLEVGRPLEHETFTTRGQWRFEPADMEVYSVSIPYGGPPSCQRVAEHKTGGPVIHPVRK